MLKKVNRLAKSSDIHEAFQKGRTFFSPHFNVRFLNQSEACRFTVVVSTKVYKSAVKRNRLKRVVRDWLRLHVKSLRPGDYIIMAKPKVGVLGTKEVLPEFVKLLAKAGLYYEKR